MAQKAQAKAFTLRSTLDDTRDISHHERPIITIAYNAQGGFHRGKRIVCNLRTCIRQGGHQRGLSGIGEAYKTHISQELQFEDDGHLLHRLTRLCITGSLVRSRAELEVTKTATTTLQKQHLLTVVGDIADVLTRLGVIDHRSTRHIDIDILAIGAMTLVLTAVTTMLGKDMALVFQMEQRPVIMVSTQNDATTLATITAIGATVGVILHVTKVHRAFAALTRAAIDLHIVYEIRFHQSPYKYRQRYGRVLLGRRCDSVRPLSYTTR